MCQKKTCVCNKSSLVVLNCREIHTYVTYKPNFVAMRTKFATERTICSRYPNSSPPMCLQQKTHNMAACWNKWRTQHREFLKSLTSHTSSMEHWSRLVTNTTSRSRNRWAWIHFPWLTIFLRPRHHRGLSFETSSSAPIAPKGETDSHGSRSGPWPIKIRTLASLFVRSLNSPFSPPIFYLGCVVLLVQEIERPPVLPILKIS